MFPGYAKRHRAKLVEMLDFTRAERHFYGVIYSKNFDLSYLKIFAFA
jgi:hypothetical protein